MADLVFQNSNGNDVTTSLIVAQVFGKRNSDVLRDIRSLNCSESFRKRNFALMVKMNELPQGGSQKSEYYEMTKDGFSFLVMGYTGTKAGEFKERFINEFNRREFLKNVWKRLKKKSNNLNPKPNSSRKLSNSNSKNLHNPLRKSATTTITCRV